MRRAFGNIHRIERKGRQPRWEARYKTPAAALKQWPTLPKVITKTFPADMKTEAERWLQNAQRDIEYGVWQPPVVTATQEKVQTITFAQYAEDWFKNHRKPDGSPLRRTTRDKYREHLDNYLLPAFGDLPLTAISYKRIKDWWDSYPVRAGGYGESNRKHLYSTLHAILAEAVRNPIDDEGTTLLATNPAKLTTTKPRPKKDYVIAEISELETVRAAMPDYMALAIDLAGDRDLREGEICGLRRKDIDFEAKKIHVRGAIKSVKAADGSRELIWEDPKTENSVRNVDMTEYIIPKLREHLEQFVEPDDEAMLFTAQRTGGYLAPQSLRNAWYKARKSVPRLENARMRFHDLRHTALTRMMENGATLGLLRDQGGHSTVEVVAVYQQFSESHRQEVLDNLNRSYAKAMGEKKQEGMATQQESDLISQLERLGDLHKAGVLDDEEFRVAKMKMLR